MYIWNCGIAYILTPVIPVVKHKLKLEIDYARHQKSVYIAIIIK